MHGRPRLARGRGYVIGRREGGGRHCSSPYNNNTQSFECRRGRRPTHTPNPPPTHLCRIVLHTRLNVSWCVGQRVCHRAREDCAGQKSQLRHVRPSLTLHPAQPMAMCLGQQHRTDGLPIHQVQTGVVGHQGTQNSGKQPAIWLCGHGWRCRAGATTTASRGIHAGGDRPLRIGSPQLMRTTAVARRMDVREQGKQNEGSTTCATLKLLKRTCSKARAHTHTRTHTHNKAGVPRQAEGRR